MTTDSEDTGTKAEETGTQQGDPAAKAAETQSQSDPKTGDKGSASADGDNPFADLPEDTREWLTKREVKDGKSAAKLAHEQSKLLGNAIRVPGKDAKPEEVEAYLNKLGRPEKPDGYEFKVPEKLPENLPYDGDRADAFKSKAHELGLNQKQAQALHDWFVEASVEDFNGMSTRQAERNAEIAKGETTKLEKLWGPLDGDVAKANLTFADKALVEAGGQEAIDEFKRVGLIGGDDKVIMSAPIAVMLAKMGRAVFKEDDVLSGSPDRLNNPFDEKSFNLTAAMKLVKEDRETALAFITAAGKKPSDFGLKA